MEKVRPLMKLDPTAPIRLIGDSKPSRLQRAEALMLDPKPPEFPPNVGPPTTDQRRQANDQVIQQTIGWAQQAYPGMGFLGFPFLAELAQISEYRQASTRLAQEMVRQWISFRSRSEEDKSDEIKQIQAEFERLEVQAVFREVAEMDGLFGRGQLYPDFGTVTDKELATPLQFDAHKIKKGSLKRLQPIEPLYSYAYNYEATEPLSPHFYKPMTWYVMKREIHHSRLLTFISRPVATMLKPMYAFSGLSMSQLAMPTIENFLKMRTSVSAIVSNYSLRGVQSNLTGLLEGGTDVLNSIVERIKIMANQASNEGLLLLDKETEAFFQHTTALTNLDKLLDQARDNMCAVVNIPRMVMFGLSPEGMNASAEGELKVFEQFVSGMQETLFRHNLMKVSQLVQLSLFGKVDNDIVFDFNPLREMDDKQLSEIRNQNSMSDNLYFGMKAVASDEVRKKLADDPNSGWNHLDLSREVVVEEPETPPANPTGSNPNEQVKA